MTLFEDSHVSSCQYYSKSVHAATAALYGSVIFTIVVISLPNHSSDPYSIQYTSYTPGPCYVTRLLYTTLSNWNSCLFWIHSLLVLRLKLFHTVSSNLAFKHNSAAIVSVAHSCVRAGSTRVSSRTPWCRSTGNVAAPRCRGACAGASWGSLCPSGPSHSTDSGTDRCPCAGWGGTTVPANSWSCGRSESSGTVGSWDRTCQQDELTARKTKTLRLEHQAGNGWTGADIFRTMVSESISFRE